MAKVTRLCHTKSMVTVNGKFPGPRIVAREGDRLLIEVVNNVPNNISIHWYELLRKSPYCVELSAQFKLLELKEEAII